MPQKDPKTVYSAGVVSVNSISTDTRELSLKPDEPFSFTPGQYVWMEIPELKIPDPKGTRRAFSIACLPNKENTISVLGRVSPSGYKQAFFSLRVGDKVKIHGPFGSLQFPKDPKVPIFSVAGGVGIAPFVSLIQDSLSNLPERKITLVTANRDGEKSPYASLFKDLQTKNPQFSLIEVSGSPKETVEKLSSGTPSAHWVIIGPKGMVYSVAELLYGKSVSESQITFEEFFVSNPVRKISEVNNLGELPDVFDIAMQQTTNHVILTDIDGYITFVNQAAQRITGYSADEMLGQTPRLWGGLESAEFYRNLWHTIKIEKKPYRGEIRNRRKTGEYYDVIVHISPLMDKSGNLMGFMGTEEDVSKMKEVDRMKTEFVSLASHQLRTPLTAIKWGLEALIGGSAGAFNQKQKDYLIDIDNSNKRMIDLVNSLLNVSRIESGRIIINPTPTNIVKLANEVISKLKMELTGKGISVVMNVADNIPQINLDTNLIFNVYQNLISNAISYSPEGSKIIVSINLKDGEIVSSVEDHGIGIRDEDKPHIFEKFFRTADVKKVRPNGSGLGLYIVKSIVESSGGKIWFDSTLGEGSTFYFSLPLSGMKPKEGEVTLS